MASKCEAWCEKAAPSNYPCPHQIVQKGVSPSLSSKALFQPRILSLTSNTLKPLNNRETSEKCHMCSFWLVSQPAQKKPNLNSLPFLERGEPQQSSVIPSCWPLLWCEPDGARIVVLLWCHTELCILRSLLRKQKSWFFFFLKIFSKGLIWVWEIPSDADVHLSSWDVLSFVP